MQEIEQQLFAPEQAAQVWGISAQKVRDMCRKGEIKCVKLGVLWRIPRAEINLQVTKEEA